MKTLFFNLIQIKKLNWVISLKFNRVKAKKIKNNIFLKILFKQMNTK